MKNCLLILFLFLCGCSRAQRAIHVAEEVTYSYDERTGLCYACYSEGFAETKCVTMTIVPYDAVKDYLVNPPTKDQQPYPLNLR